MRKTNFESSFKDLYCKIPYIAWKHLQAKTKNNRCHDDVSPVDYLHEDSYDNTVII